jgi:glycosyltransferase involved in cell wall biosynthesis
VTDKKLRVVVHDFSGHPFQVQLARELARRGYETTHLFCPSFQTPKGRVGDDDGNFSSRPVALYREFAKYSGAKRLVQETEYGIRVGREILQSKPDVVLTANTPLIAAVALQLILLMRRVPIVFWQQDVYSVAMSDHLNRKGGPIGRLAGKALIQLEKWLLRSSREVVVISEDFLRTLDKWKIARSKVTVAENWAPLDELPISERPNPWSAKQGIDDEIVLLYAGSLGLKHDPSMLLELARSFQDRSDVRVVVISEGRGATWLEKHCEPNDRLTVLPFQSFNDMPDVLATADVTLVLLEPNAGEFSVPSKVLTYHCAGRPILGAIPSENLAARIINRAGSGTVVDPGDTQMFVSEAKRLIDDAELRVAMGQAAREYATENFDIERIGSTFAEVLESALGRPKSDSAVLTTA